MEEGVEGLLLVQYRAPRFTKTTLTATTITIRSILTCGVGVKNKRTTRTADGTVPCVPVPVPSIARSQLLSQVR